MWHRDGGSIAPWIRRADAEMLKADLSEEADRHARLQREAATFEIAN
jgi:hypothetical protein